MPHGHRLLCRFQDCLVKNIVGKVLLKLPAKPIRAADHPVDMEHRMQPVWQGLERHGIVGLYGMGGIGKSTIANAIYNQLRNSFPGASCHVMVGQAPSMEQLQTRILDTLCGPYLNSNGIEENHAELQHRLRKRRVLLVLDDIWTESQLKHLLVPLHPDSRVIVTSRKRSLLESSMGGLCSRQPAYLEASCLSENASLELFCRHAFPIQQRYAPCGWESLSAKAAKACAGLPLSLTVIGSFLKGKVQLGQWRNALDRLHKAESLTGDREDSLFSILKLSFDDLAKRERDMFMDVACVLLGQCSKLAECAWEESLGLDNLKSRSLVSIDEEGRLGMHDQLRDMGRSFLETDPRFCNKYVWDQEVCIFIFQHLGFWQDGSDGGAARFPRTPGHVTCMMAQSMVQIIAAGVAQACL